LTLGLLALSAGRCFTGSLLRVGRNWRGLRDHQAFPIGYWRQFQFMSRRGKGDDTMSTTTFTSVGDTDATAIPSSFMEREKEAPIAIRATQTVIKADGAYGHPELHIPLHQFFNFEHTGRVAVFPGAIVGGGEVIDAFCSGCTRRGTSFFVQYHRSLDYCLSICCSIAHYVLGY